MSHNSINFHEKLTYIQEYWTPKVISQMNNYQLKLVKVKGEFIWHRHKDTDETFIVLEGTLHIALRDHIVVLQANMQNVRFPNIFFSFKQLSELFNKNNYELIFQTKRKVGKYTHNILGKDEFFVKDLIYKLKT